MHRIHLWLTAMFGVCAVLLAIPAANAQELKMLVIGNSFSNSIRKDFPRIVESFDDCKLTIRHASLGGCSLKRHWENAVKDEEKSEGFRPYSEMRGEKRVFFSLKEALTADRWDVVTIQQASHDSWQPATFDPYAKNLVNYIRKHAPTADVVIQQTWAYRFDDVRLAKWGIDQAEMYRRLSANYAAAAEELQCRVIPTGLAVQLARETQPAPYVPYAPEAVKELKYPAALPSSAGSFVRGHRWEKTTKDGKTTHSLRLDAFHLNRRGEYLQSCVWFSTLFGKAATEIKYVPDDVDAKDAKFLREVAQKAVETYKQAK